jgi:cobyrinic acid a,c-diamide synthase
MSIPRIIVAGTQSGVGKTTISIGLMAALKDAGYTVQGFKVGPDYIDPSYHNIVTGRCSENLDVWLAPKDQIVEIFSRAILGADFAVIEGVMGLYDSVSGTDETGSTAQIAKLLACPVVLVIDASQTVRSAAAVALGFKNFDKQVKIKGIILNNVTGATHANWCIDAIEAAAGLPVVGWLPINSRIKLPERHLGLIPTPEQEEMKEFIPEIKTYIKTHIKIPQIVDIANSRAHLPKIKRPVYPHKPLPKFVKVAVAFDEAFNFYYPGNLSLLENYGAEIVRFSPIHDNALPVGVDGLYIGGGFPEFFLPELEANQSMRKSVLSSIEVNMPTYGECAGLMYLTNGVTNFDGKNYHMVGALNGTTVMTNKTLVTYSHAKAIMDNVLCSTGSEIRGHEFHNSIIVDLPSDAKFAYSMVMGEGISNKKDGWIKNNTIASYTHIHFAQDKKIVKTFLNYCKSFSKDGGNTKKKMCARAA